MRQWGPGPGGWRLDGVFMCVQFSVMFCCDFFVLLTFLSAMLLLLAAKNINVVINTISKLDGRHLD